VGSNTDDSPPSGVVTKNGVELYLCFVMVWYLIKFRYKFTFMFAQVKPRSVRVRIPLVGNILQVSLGVYRALSLVVRLMPGYTSQRRGMVRTLLT
jgi:hypothetical protein